MAARSQGPLPRPLDPSLLRQQSYTAPVGSPTLSPTSTLSANSSSSEIERESYFHAPVPRRPHVLERLRSFTQLHRSESSDPPERRDSSDPHQRAHRDERRHGRNWRRSRSRSRSPVTESTFRAREERYAQDAQHEHDHSGGHGASALAHALPLSLPHIPTANIHVRTHHKKRPKMMERPRSQGTFTDCGRHGNDWLFGGFSVTGTVKHWLKDEGKS